MGQSLSDNFTMKPDELGYPPLSCLVVFLWVAAYDMYTGRVMVVGSHVWSAIVLLTLMIIVVPRRGDWCFTHAWRQRLAFGGAASVGLLALFALSERTVLVKHDAPFGLIQIVAGLLTLFDHKAVPLSGEVAIWTDLAWRRIACHLELLGVEYWLPIVLWCLCLCSVIISPVRRLRFVVQVFGIFAAYQILRFSLMAVLCSETEWLDVLWNPIVSFLPQVPLALLLDRLASKYLEKRALVGECSFRSLFRCVVKTAYPLPLIGFFVGLLLFVLAFWFKPVGNPHFGRILIDDSHSNWEWSTHFGRNSFGEKATYGYGSLRFLLNRYWPTDVNESSLLDSLELSPYQVVVLKTPTKPYTKNEIAAILEFVREGGGLWLLGDHDNLFGMGQYLNSISTNANIRFEFNDQFDLVSGLPTSYRPSRLWAHPIVAGLKNLDFLTSCTIQSPLGSDVIIGRGMCAEPVEYSHVNFFGNMKADSWERWGCFNQMACVTYGRGRIVAFSDSTIFSNFCMYFDEKPALALRSVCFLSHRPSFFEREIQHWLGFVAVIILLISLAACMLLGCFTPISTAVLGAGTLGFVTILGIISAAQLKLPPRTLKTAVVFEASLSSFKLPAMLDWSPEALKDPNAFDSFFINVSRMGLEPYIGNPLHLEGRPSLRCIIYPNDYSVESGPYKQLINEVRGGGQLMIVGEWWHPAHVRFVERLLSQEGISCSWKSILTTNCLLNVAKHEHKHVVVNGGRRLCFGGNEHELDVTEFFVGEGRIFLVGGGKTLSREGFGQVYSPDKAEVRALSEFQYAIFDYVIGNNSNALDMANTLRRYLILKRDEVIAARSRDQAKTEGESVLDLMRP
ncbi:MAG TPA: hypothetical protein DCZ95_05235 [Verrucomicrobia bacterium]|nr:hypothetical protein [Verrucomicrobiota bacterium]